MLIPGSVDTNKIMEIFMKGDSRCKYPIGTRVEKNGEEKHDHHMDGTKATVIGNHYLVNDEKLPDMGTYMVHFDGDAEHVATFTTELKLRLESKSE